MGGRLYVLTGGDEDVGRAEEFDIGGAGGGSVGSGGTIREGERPPSLKDTHGSGEAPQDGVLSGESGACSVETDTSGSREDGNLLVALS